MTVRPVPLTRAALVLTICAAFAACSNSSPNGPTTTGSSTKVTATASLAFTPPTVSIHPGDSVTWVFQSVGHTVTFDAVAGAPANIGSVSSPQANVSVTRVFAVAGTYTYHCSIHPTMTGSVVVADNAISPPPPPPPPPDTGYNPYGQRRPGGS